MEKELYGRAKTKIYMERILDVLRQAERPLYIAEVQRRAGIKDWHAARGIVYRLVSKGLVKAMDTERETLFQIAEPKESTVSYWAPPIPEIATLLEKPKLEVTLKHGSLQFTYGDRKLKTKPVDWTQLLHKYTLEAVAKAFEKELLAEGFPLKQGELLPEMKKALRK